MLLQDVGRQKPRRRVSDPVCGGGGGGGGGGDGALGPVPPAGRLKNRDFPLSARRRRSGSAPERRVNCVLVGDGAVGKTSLVVSYTTNGYPTEYVPTAFDNFTVMVVVDGKPVRLQLCDMAGQDELDRLRPLCYKNADVFLLCYSVVRPCSFRNLIERWVPEIRQHCPDAPLVLVGTQVDLKEDVQVLIHLAQNQQRPVDAEEGRRLAQELGAVGFAECSALTQKNLKDAFDSAILASFQQTDSSSSGVQQRLTLRRKTPDKIKSLSETWWRKISCLMGEQSCEFE
ncbi:putative rho-related GTP-binding protein RhoU-like [Scophthalmus maximus]|uniref:Putative rho-related GTP-binding protein RhoU-like n=1 Tax=Scophthalmus maximus TaxID=52904 RepID=A0A2U9BM35_SCOMX|nr:putative rho-related GTP-binding protein RhoU-like [Scophthalmus maximus]